MRLTEAQKRRIALYREQNVGYGEIAKKMGISKTTVRAYCSRHQLDGFRAANTAPAQNEKKAPAPSCAPQQSMESKETPAEEKNKRGKKEIHPTVTLVFAKEPNYEAVEEVKRILLNARLRTETDVTRKKKK